MGQKVNPISFRLSVRRNWESRWFAPKADFPALLHSDYEIRKFLHKKLKFASLAWIYIERSGSRIRIKLFSARPGVIIGRRGQELEKIKAEVEKLTNKEVLLDIQEIKKADLVAQLVANNIALQLERRISFRRAMKMAIKNTMSIGAKGIKIKCSGRLGGAEIARSEEQRAGRVPLQTIRENIDYGFAEANTIYGIIGVKCWICNDTEENFN